MMVDMPVVVRVWFSLVFYSTFSYPIEIPKPGNYYKQLIETLDRSLFADVFSTALVRIPLSLSSPCILSSVILVALLFELFRTWAFSFSFFWWGFLQVSKITCLLSSIFVTTGMWIRILLCVISRVHSLPNMNTRSACDLPAKRLFREETTSDFSLSCISYPSPLLHLPMIYWLFSFSYPSLVVCFLDLTISLFEFLFSFLPIHRHRHHCCARFHVHFSLFSLFFPFLFLSLIYLPGTRMNEFVFLFLFSFKLLFVTRRIKYPRCPLLLNLAAISHLNTYLSDWYTCLFSEFFCSFFFPFLSPLTSKSPSVYASFLMG